VKFAIATAAAGEVNHDRARVFPTGEGVTIALADGAGRTAYAVYAAQAWIDLVGESLGLRCPWGDVIERLDGDRDRRGVGETTAIAISAHPAALGGACAGDSSVWLVLADRVIDLAEGAQHKPLVGAGCTPFPIVPRGFAGGTLLVASDGLTKYASRDAIAALAREDDLDAAVLALVSLARLPTGALQDDTTVVLCRPERR
jgi:PPM family protein phosphatase